MVTVKEPRRTRQSTAPNANGSQAGNGRRDRRRAATREQILRSATSLFQQHGFGETTVEDITNAADIGKGTFFNYFPSKEHVLLALFAEVSRDFRKVREDSAQVKSVREYLHEFVHYIISTRIRTPMLVRSIFGTALTNATIAHPFQNVLQTARESIATLLERGQRSGEVRSDIAARDLARTLQQLMIGTEIIWALHGPAELLASVDLAFEIFWEGVSARKRRAGGEAGEQS